MTLVSALDVQPWCTKHRRMLSGAPRLSWDSRKQAWAYTLSDCLCPVAQVSTDCVTSWACSIEVEQTEPPHDVCGWPRQMGGRCGAEPFYDGEKCLICIEHASEASAAGLTLRQIVA